MIRRRPLLAAAALAAPGLAQAQAPRFPDRPIELVVGFAPGGGTDVTARTFARFLEPRLGGPVVVQNRAGASGELAWGYVARARPDGHVIGITNWPSIVTLTVERTSPQYTLDSFDYVGNLVVDPSGLVVKADSPLRDLAGLLAQARAEPEGTTFATSGVGTDDHLLLVLMEQATGVRLTPVHYTGAAPMRTALLGRQVQVAAINVGEMMPAPEGLRMLAQAGAHRSRLAPEVPTLRELGVPVEMSSERGIITAAGTPPAVLAKLRTALEEVVRSPDFVAAIEAQFTEPAFEPGEAWGNRLHAARGTMDTLWRRSPWVAR